MSQRASRDHDAASGIECVDFARLARAVHALGSDPDEATQVEIDDVRWRTLSVLWTGSTGDPFWVAVSHFDVYYRLAGQVTARDVRTLREQHRLAMMRPIVVVAAADGFTLEALRSVRRSRWIDFFSGAHMPLEWKRRLAESDSSSQKMP